MNEQDAIDMLNALDDSDPESAHVTADEILCQLIRDIGYGDAAKAYEETRKRIGFWYA
jgi:hypothetical protein